MIEAVEESAVDCFTLKPSNPLICCVPLAGHIKTCSKDFIFVEITEREHCNYVLNHPDRSFDIFFHVNRVTFQLQHYALEWIQEHQLFNLFVNSSQYNSNTNDWTFDGPATDVDYTFRFCDLIRFFFFFNWNLIGNFVCDFLQRHFGTEIKCWTKIGRNQYRAGTESTIAVSIVWSSWYVHCTVLGVVYVWFIFTKCRLFLTHLGTGKTRTLVAAIEEIVRTTSKSVLVCANSNSACDEIVTRLVGILEMGEMFRMYGRSYDVRKVGEKIKPICNWLKGEFRFPSLSFLYRFRVLVCTLTTAGCLTRSTDNPQFSSCHFSHIIIDESASTHETVSMIPIAGEFTDYFSHFFFISCWKGWVYFRLRTLFFCFLWC